MAMERQSLHYKNNKTGMQKETISAVDSKSNVQQVRAPNQTSTHVTSTNLLPSKFDKLLGRPLPPLERTGSQVHKNDSRTSFKPAKLSDHRAHRSVPLKGQHALTDNSSMQTTLHFLKVHTAARREESMHTASADNDSDLAKNQVKNKTRLRRSHSVSRLSGSSSTPSNTAPAELCDVASVSPDMKPARPTTPQQLAVNKTAGIKVNEQLSVGCGSPSGKSDCAVAQLPRRRSSSVSSSARIPLHKTYTSRTSSPSTVDRHGKQADVTDSTLVQGKLKSNCAKDNLLKMTTSRETSESHNAHHSVRPVCSKSLDQDTRDSHLYNVKALEKSSLNHGILGGKSDDGLKSAVDIDQRSLPGASECCYMVCMNYFVLYDEG